jgi:bifunctional non-homologous end joining protein LigD
VAEVGAVPFEGDDGDQWLLIHKADDAAQPGWDAEDYPQSVKTGRTNDEVKANRDAIWISQAPAAVAEIDLAGAKTAPMPQKIEPMAATLAGTPFDDEDWLFEIKWDGFRVEAVVDEGKTRILTRNLNDAATYFPRLLGPSSRWIEAQQAIVDGEVVALDDDGKPDFSLLQTKLGDKEATGLVYQVFDLMYLDGRSLLDVPLEDRKRLLRSVLKEHPRVRFASHVVGEGKAFFDAAGTIGVEGMVAKLRRSRYEPGRRSGAWLKIKIRPEQEFVVGGWTPGSGNARDLGALAIGVYEGDKLRFTGKVGSGFTGLIRKDLLKRLEPLVQDDPPFDPAPPKDYRGRWGGDLKDITWVRPEIVIRAEIGGWTRDGQVRQTAYKGIDSGRDPRDVVKETAVATTAAIREAEAAEPERPVQDQEVPMPSKSKSKSPSPATSSKPAKASTDSPSTPAFDGPTAAEMKALDDLGKEGVWTVGGRDLKLTNLDKPLFDGRARPNGDAEAPITKRELIRFYASIAPTMLPHLWDRPLNLHRFPNGAGAPGFWQKDIPETAPKWLKKWHETGVEGREDRDANDHLLAVDAGSLAWLANQASFEIHAWTGKLPEPWQPTFAYIDIDPGENTTWDETLTLARLYKTALEHLSVRGYPKTTGKRGIQIWIPIVQGKYDFSDTSAWVERVSRAVGSTVPDLILGSGRRRRARAGPASITPRTRPSRRSSRRTRSDLRRAPRSARRSPGTSWTTRRSDRTDGPSGRCRPAWRRSETCSPRHRRTHRNCPQSDGGAGRLAGQDDFARARHKADCRHPWASVAYVDREVAAGEPVVESAQVAFEIDSRDRDRRRGVRDRGRSRKSRPRLPLDEERQGGGSHGLFDASASPAQALTRWSRPRAIDHAKSESRCDSSMASVRTAHPIGRPVAEAPSATQRPNALSAATALSTTPTSSR